ncbi:CAZyme family GT34 [Paecilomyces variotii]|nr:CAZyme family GT34 [Paecilomyces variotii]KAJ9256604.1 CAZyme family GT34 [Paecilomyces variotii]KAJ9270841.1 CAZyme family GT34 [Paecilomyces variotii]KAJ9352494.1 CAZyme family GT34 [Paecilomyces variotii]KAJ9394110.1 CAZyme family GT34 [Paecilomyces variotii]
MQFALPPRKSPHAHPYPRSSRLSFQRRRQLKAAAVLGFALLSILFLASHFFSSSDTESAAILSSAPEVVLVTVFDRDVLSKSYIEKVKKNREYYAARHGYANFFANVSDYEYALNNAPRSWAVVPAVRHAMTQHPHSAYFFHLSPHSLIMNPSVSMKSLVTDSKRLESLMIKDIPVVPPDSVIRTFSHLQGQDVDLILTQDKEDLSSGSFILRQGTWGKYFLDVWFDPLYRNYNFAKAEIHALDHIVQWHPTILAKLALVPQRIINAYSRDSNGATTDGTYKEGDFLIRAMGCDTEVKRNCEQELEPYYSQWQRSISH